MSRRIGRRAAVFFLSLCLFVGLAGGSALADVAISAAPSLFEVSATPGGVGSQQITVTNAGSEPFAVLAEIAQYKSGEGDLSAVAWLKVEPAAFNLAPGQRQAVKVTITIPQDAGAGGRYAMVAFRTGGKPSDGSAVGVVAQVGVPFLITVNGAAPLPQQSSLSGLVPVLETNDSLGFRAAVENNGSTHFYARGTVDVASGDGRPWGRLELRDSTAILPGTGELLHSDRPIPFREGITYRAKAAVSFGEGSPEIREIEFLATPMLEIVEITPETTSAGELDVRLKLRNSGGLGLLPRIMMAVRGEQGDIAGVLSPNRQPLVWPGQIVELDARYPGKLAPGSYALVARVEFGADSVQQEAPFRIDGSSSQAGASVPVGVWAAPAPSQPQPASTLPQEEAPPLQGSTPEVQEDGGLVGGALATLLPMSAFGLAGVLVVMYRRRPRSAVTRRHSTLALPAPRTLGGIFAEQLRRRRHRPAYHPTELLPPPPLHLLPAPKAREFTVRQPQYHGAIGTMVEDQASSHHASPGERTPGISIKWMSSEMALARNVADEFSMPKQGKRSRFSSAVAEKASMLVGEARRAAQSGDRVAVERLSRQALQLDARNVDAWLWLAASCDDAQSARMCLEAVQILDPPNIRAKRALASLDGGSTGNGRPEGRWAATGHGQGAGPGAFSQPKS